MPVHDWTRVDAGIFHAFHHDWITELARALNRGLLPAAYYALPEQYAAGFGPGVLTLQEEQDGGQGAAGPKGGGGGVLLAPPKLQPTGETDMAFYRRKQKAVAVRHVSLPAEYFALVEQRIQGPIPDVLTLKLSPGAAGADRGTTGLAVAAVPPRARLVRRTEAGVYANKANRFTVRHRHGDVLAMVEIVSPGNQASRAEFRTFLEKTTELIRQGIHLLLIDLFPPGPRDPHRLGKRGGARLGSSRRLLPFHPR